MGHSARRLEILLNSTEPDGKQGAMCTGRKLIDGKWATGQEQGASRAGCQGGTTTPGRLQSG